MKSLHWPLVMPSHECTAVALCRCCQQSEKAHHRNRSPGCTPSRCCMRPTARAASICWCTYAFCAMRERCLKSAVARALLITCGRGHSEEAWRLRACQLLCLTAPYVQYIRSESQCCFPCAAPCIAHWHTGRCRSHTGSPAAQHACFHRGHMWLAGSVGTGALRCAPQSAGLAHCHGLQKHHEAPGFDKRLYT